MKLRERIKNFYKETLETFKDKVKPQAEIEDKILDMNMVDRKYNESYLLIHHGRNI